MRMADPSRCLLEAPTVSPVPPALQAPAWRGDVTGRGDVSQRCTSTQEPLVGASHTSHAHVVLLHYLM